MPICKACGTNSPDNLTRCVKCGVALGSQFRADADLRRAKTRLMVRAVIWVAVVIALVAVAPSVYHKAGTAYYKYHLKSVSEGAMVDCGGPIVPTMRPDQKTQVDTCLAGNADLKKAKADYAAFTNTAEH